MKMGSSIHQHCFDDDHGFQADLGDLINPALNHPCAILYHNEPFWGIGWLIQDAIEGVWGFSQIAAIEGVHK